MSTELDSSKVLTLTPVPVVPVPTQTTAPTAPESAEPTPPPMPVTTGALDTRTLSRSLFLRLRALDAEGAAADSPERTYVRDTLIELNLPSSGTRPPASAPATSPWRTSSRSAPSA